MKHEEQKIKKGKWEKAPEYVKLCRTLSMVRPNLQTKEKKRKKKKTMLLDFPTRIPNKNSLYIFYKDQMKSFNYGDLKLSEHMDLVIILSKCEEVTTKKYSTLFNHESLRSGGRDFIYEQGDPCGAHELRQKSRRNYWT